MANAFEVDLSNVKTTSFLSNFEDGWYYARVTEGKIGLSQKSDPQLELTFELMSDKQGAASIKQNITVNMGFLLKPFYIAIEDLSQEEFEADPVLRVKDPSAYEGRELLVHIGRKKGNKVDDEGNPRYFKNITEPFFLPLSRYDELNDAGKIK